MSNSDPEKDVSPNFTLDLALEIPLPLSRKTTSGDIQNSSQSRSQGYSQGYSQGQKLQPGIQVPGFHMSSQNVSQTGMAFNFETMRKPGLPPPAATLTQPRVPFSQPPATYNQFSQHIPATITRPQSYFQPIARRFIRPLATYLQHQATLARLPASCFQTTASLQCPQVGPMASHSQSNQPTAKYSIEAVKVFP